MITLKILIVLLVFVNVYMVVNKINSTINRSIYEARGEDKKENLKTQLRRIEKRAVRKEKVFNLFERKKRKIKRQGNPLNLNIIQFYLIKIVPTVAVITIFIYFRAFNIMALIITVISYNFIDIVYFLSNMDDNNKIKEDLPNIYDVLDIQSAAGVNLGMALTEVFDIPKSKRFRKNLIELSAEINLTKNIEQALDNFIDNYNLIELESFVLAIKQSIKSGRNRELLSNQSEILKENNLLSVSEKTKQIDIWLMLIGVLMFIGITAIIILSFKEQIGNNLQNIF